MSQVELPNESSGRSWILCGYPGCPGEAAPNHGKCYLHLDDTERAHYLGEVAQGSVALTLSGLTVTASQFAGLLAAMPQSSANPSGSARPVVPADARFDETTFADYVDAQHVTFARSCSMSKAKFERGVIWNGSHFGSLDLQLAVLKEKADFGNVTIAGRASWAGLRAMAFLSLVRGDIAGDLDLRWAASEGIWLSYTRVHGKALLREGNFDSSHTNKTAHKSPRIARFDGLNVEGEADFSNAMFPSETTVGGYADMPPATFANGLSLEGCTFGNPIEGGRHLLQRLALADFNLSGCTFYGRVSLAGCRSAGPFVIANVAVKQPSGPIEPDDNDHLFPPASLDLTDLSLDRGGRLSRINIEGTLTLHCAQLEGELEIADVRVTESAEVKATVFDYAPSAITADERLTFSRCLFQRGGILSCTTQDLSFIECDARQPLVVTSPGTPATLTSLMGTNVEHFVLVGLNLAGTSFGDASNLDRLSIQGTPNFLRAPSRLGRGRQIIIDEVPVRALKHARWRELFSANPTSSQSADPQAVAATYRALRKNREDSKDEPGGADFYYGEMEMRRRAASPFSVERLLLTVYWCTSGYALRAWRALSALFLVLLLGGYLLDQHGYDKSAAGLAASSGGIVDASLVLAQVALALARTPQGLNTGGTIIVICTRVLCPALLALAVLALRSRVKR